MESRVVRSGYGVEELKKKVDHLIELNLERCRAIQGKGEMETWIDGKKAQ
jgi:hypothetical protein